MNLNYSQLNKQKFDTILLFTACVTPGELENGSFKEILRKKYAEDETVSFVCSEIDFFRAEPSDPKSSDDRHGLITCGRDGWLAQHECIQGKIKFLISN